VWRLLSMILLLASGCDCGFHAVADCGTACDGGSDAGVPDAGPPCTGCITGSVGWGYNGGLVVFEDSSSLSACRTYVHHRVIYNPMGMQGCEADLEQCPGVNVARLAALLEDPIVTSALKSHTLFGTDPRPTDGALFEISTDAGTLDVGWCASSQCLPDPVKELQDLLVTLDRNQLSVEPCKSNIHPP
jgi:hypothetical protein